MNGEKMTTRMTRRQFWALPGAAIATATLAKRVEACQVIATCIASTDTTVTIRVQEVVTCTPTVNVVRVRYIEKPATYPGVMIDWTAPGVTTMTFAVTTLPTNVTVTGLTCGKEYVLQVALGFNTMFGAPSEITSACRTQCPTGGCTRTQGYWKNHEEAWPVSSLVLGTNGQTYSKAQLLTILRTPVGGNGLISLAHQLIAAKLNSAAGAGCTAATALIAQADAKIGARVIGLDTLPSSETSGLVSGLDNYNNGNLEGCSAHCAD
jgi:hypothetical protein